MPIPRNSITCFFFFLNDPAPTEFSSLPLPAALPISIVTAVSRSKGHTFSKPSALTIRLVAGLGVEGDAHLGEKVQHLYAARKNPNAPNLRQRSEEHTSELQSPCNLVCRLLLDKKKNV